MCYDQKMTVIQKWRNSRLDVDKKIENRNDD
jgi:hypothetical protein